MTSPVLSMQDVNLFLANRSGAVHVLKDVSLRVGLGEALGILGENGAGKSLLLKVMHGILVPESGTIDKFGYESELLSLAMNMNPKLTGRQNAFLTCLLRGLGRTEATEMLDQINDFAELGHSFDQPVGTYSTGMRARLSFSVANNVRAKLLLVDELLSVGDQSFRTKSQDAMEKTLRDGSSIVVVSHNLTLIRELCTTCIVLEDGRVTEVGACSEVVPAYREKMDQRHVKSN